MSLLTTKLRHVSAVRHTADAECALSVAGAQSTKSLAFRLFRKALVSAAFYADKFLELIEPKDEYSDRLYRDLYRRRK